MMREDGFGWRMVGDRMMFESEWDSVYSEYGGIVGFGEMDQHSLARRWRV